MSYYYIGNFSRHASEIIHIKDPSETENLRYGDIVEKWNHVFEWDEHCLTSSQLERWRTIGDPLCDGALKSMFHSSSASIGLDLLECLQTKAAAEPDGPCRALLDEVSKPPPSDIAATKEQIRLAQMFYLRHSVAIMQSLMHFSLSGGFASPRISRVLQSVSYLVPRSKVESTAEQQTEMMAKMNDRTYARLLETFQFVLDVMGCSQSGIAIEESLGCLEPGGEGWKAALRVRLLHGVARRRILDHLNSPSNIYSVDADGTPLNQEDMAATLGSFGVAPLWCMPKIYVSNLPVASEEEHIAYISTWRHIGYYLGIKPSILRAHFSSPEVASKFLASSIVHLLTSEGGNVLPPTMPILRAISNRRPFPKTLAFNCALTRTLLGPSLSSHLGVPSTSFMEDVRVYINRVYVQIPVLFAWYYPRRTWDVTRCVLVRTTLPRIVRFQLGMRKTTFRVRTNTGEISDEVLSMESIKPDDAGRKLIMRRWRILLAEMVLVVSAVLIAPICISIRLYFR